MALCLLSPFKGSGVPVCRESTISALAVGEKRTRKMQVRLQRESMILAMRLTRVTDGALNGAQLSLCE
jgi:hypothetical protein